MKNPTEHALIGALLADHMAKHGRGPLVTKHQGKAATLFLSKEAVVHGEVTGIDLSGSDKGKLEKVTIAMATGQRRERPRRKAMPKPGTKSSRRSKNQSRDIRFGDQ